MSDNNKLPEQAKPQEFELVELLFREYISSHIARPDIEYSFQARFQSLINQIPSYLHSVSKTGFFIHFFFGSFASVLDTKLAQTLGIQKLHFNFDSADHLRIVAETDDKTHVFIFTENNKHKKQKKNQDIGFTKDEWKTITGREYTDDDNKKLEISVIHINKSTGSINVAVEKQDIQDAVDSIKPYHEMIKQFVDAHGQYIALEDEILKLANSAPLEVRNALKLILEYTKKIHNHYQGLPYGDKAREADEHGFVAGIFNNFRYRENAHVYLEQFAGKGYADMVLLVRGSDRTTKSIPIIIELKAGIGSGTSSDDALTQVEKYTKGFQPNNMRILSLSDNILCVGMNLDMPTDSFIQTQVVARDQVVAPLIQQIINQLVTKDILNQNPTPDDLIVIQQTIKQYLEQTYNIFPGTREKSSAHYMSRFILGESLVLRDYDKHIFIYDKESYIPTATVIDDHNTRSSKKPRIERTLDGSNAVNSILFIPISSADSPVILVNIIDVNRDIIVNNIRLDSGLIGDRKIVQLNIQFNIDKYKESFKEYCNIQLLKIYASISEYNQASIQVKGKLHLVAEDVSDNLSEYLQQAISSQNGLVISEYKYKELLAKVGEIVYPIKSLIGKESEFQGLLEGIFKYHSDAKLSEGFERRELVLTEFQTGAGGRIDMLVQTIGSSDQGTKEYTSVGLELKYDNTIYLRSSEQGKSIQEREILLNNKAKSVIEKLLHDQIERYKNGAAIKSITDGNKVAIMGVVFNVQAQDHSSLLLTTGRFHEAEIVHSSKLYSVGTVGINTNDLPKPDSEYFMPDWVEQEVYNTLTKTQGNEENLLSLFNKELDDNQIKQLKTLLKNDRDLQSIDGLDLSFNKITATGLKELVDISRTKLIYLDLSDNDLATDNFADLEVLIRDIKVPILKIADIGMNNLQVKKTIELLTAQDSVSHLEIQHLDSFSMTQDTANSIAGYLQKTQQLNYLDVSKSGIDDQDILIIAQALKGQKTLNHLILIENMIGELGANDLGSALSQSSISFIDVSGNPLGIKGMASIVKGLQNSKVEVIKLVNVQVHNPDDQDNKKLLLNTMQELFSHSQLTSTDISYNNVGNDALMQIFYTLSRTSANHQLKDLSLAGNEINWSTPEINTIKLHGSISYFLTNLCKNKIIRSLDLSFMDIDDKIGATIAKELEQNQSLISLDLSGNDRIGTRTISALAKTLNGDIYLKYLNLADNELKIEDLKQLIDDGLKWNKDLTHLNLAGNNFSDPKEDGHERQILDLDHQYVDFKNLLRGNGVLKYLNLSNCKLNSKSLESLFLVLKENSSLEVLNVRGNIIDSTIIESIIEALRTNANQGLDGLKVLYIDQGNLDHEVISKLREQSLGISVLVDDDVLTYNHNTIGESDLSGISIRECLPGTSRGKRSINKCKIGWLDVDEISSIKTRKSEDIIIDSQKFLKYSKQYIKDEQKSLQLVRLAEEIKNKGGVRIVGEYQGLLEQVIQDGGYNNYIQKSRISAIGHHVIKKINQINSSPVLQLKLINVAGQIQLISGVHVTIVLCQDDLTSNDCILSVSALGYSFLAQPLEMLMVQVIRPMIAKHTATVANKIIPKVVLYDAKFVVQILNVQYGAKIAKGTAGALAGLFDVVDIVGSSKVLIACSERTNANPCSSKEIRDNIASIGFGGVSFISGIMVRGPHGVAIGLVLLVAQRIYSGISNIIEYEEKYDTTIGEDLSIFWRTALLRSMAQDVVSLQYRSDNMNSIVHEIAQYLRNNTNNVVGYAIGLGRIELEYKPLCRKKTVKVPVYCIGLRPTSGPCAYGKDGYIEQNQTVCDIRSQYIPSMVQDHSFINAKYTSTDYTNTLSRVLPKPVDKMKMVCLPQATNAEYEKGIKNTRIDAQYYCDNALMVMSDDQNRKVNLKNQYILYNLQYIKVGFIFASNIYHNRFLVNNGTINIYGGDNVKNEFTFLSNEFLGTIFLGVNSTNIIDASQLQDVAINFTIKNLYSIADFSHAILNNAFIVQHHHSNDINLHYIGRQNKIDNIVCDVFGNTLINNTMKYYAPISSILIDGGGGYNDTHEDLIQNCNIVKIKPYTRVQGINSSYTLYIPTKQYANQSLNSTIDVYGNGTIIFPNIRLLRDSIITYASINNTLSCKILIDNGTYTIDIINYLNRYNKAQFVLIDQDSTNTIYQHTINNNQIIRHFSLYIECQFTTRQEVVNHYRTIAYSKEDYTVFGTVKNKQYNHLLKFGSSGKDIIIIDQNIVYVEGKENNDIYIVQHNTNSVYINNKAEDLKLDILQLPINSTNTVLVIKNNENLHLIFNITIDKLQNHQYIQQEVIIEQYFQGNIYQHIAVMDLSNNTFIPFDTKNSEVKLLSFYHASTVRSIWVLPANIQNAVLDITRDNIIFYRKGDDVLLTEKQTYAFNSLNIILKDYYIEQNQWSNVSLYSYNNSIKGIIDLYNIEVSAISYQNLHDSVIQEYTIDTTKESQEIQHNQERLGVVIFQNMSFDRLEVTARNNNLVLLDSIDNNKEILIIKNWYKHNKYKSVMFEFSSGLEPDRIYISDRIEKKINFNNKLSKEILNIGNNVVKSVISYLILTCDQQATLAQRLTYSFLKASSSDLSLEEIKQNINTTISARALVLLAAKAYNKLSLKYDIEKKNILQNSCFSTVLLPLKIQEIIQYVDSTDLNQIEQFIHKNTHEIHSITTSNIPLLNDSHKHRHHHGEHVAHHRGRRDIDHAWEIAAAAQDDHNDDLIDLRDDILEVSRDSSLTPWGYNIVNWIRNNILLTFKDIDPLGSVKNLWNVYNDNTNTTIYDLDVSDNLGYRDSKNQDAVVDKFTMMQKINSKISELEERKIEVTKLLRALYQKLNSAEKELHKYRQDQYEYEEELSNTLLTLIKRKLDIQKQEVDTAKINNDVEKIKQSIQDNELLNCHYTREIQMLKKEQWGDTITDIYYEDRIKYLKEQIKSCEEEDIRLNNALQALEAQKTEDYTESSLVKERIFQLVRPLNIEEAKILQEEDELAIMHKNQQEQQQEIYHIKDQIELQKSLIENLRCELNVLNQELAMLNVEDNNLSLHYELPYWNGSLEKNVEVDCDIADQLPLSISGSHHINVGNLSNLFIGNDTDKNQVLDDSLCDFQGTVSLWNLLMRKKYGVHYNHQHDIIQGKEINTEYDHILAYNAYYNTSKENLEYNLGSIGSIAQYDDKI